MYNQSLRIARKILSLRTCYFPSRIVQTNKVFNLMRAKFASLSNSSIELSVNSAELSRDLENMSGAGDEGQFTLHYEGLLEAQKNENVLIIDVREHKEIDETGKLPGSIHIPMGEVSKVLDSSDEEFVRKYDKLKPDKHTKIVLSCRAGMRSAKVQKELQQLGYDNVYNYLGGWSEWETNQQN